MKITPLYFIVVAMLISFNLFAGPWEKEKVYQSGDVVEFENRYYLAGYWNQNMQPIDNDISWDGWISITNESVDQWNDQQAYTAGSIVQFNNENYIAKWWAQGSEPHLASSPWVKLAVGVGEKPAPDDKYNILGQDKDGNGIRDSYELFIEKNYQDPVIKAYLKTAAREYGKLLELHLDKKLAESLTVDLAEDMVNNLVTFMFCNRKLRKEGRLPLNSSPINEYYNTIERAIARHKASRVLSKKVVDESFNPYKEKNICGSLIQGDK